MKQPTKEELKKIALQFLEINSINNTKQQQTTSPKKIRRKVYHSYNQSANKTKFNLPIININKSKENYLKFVDNYNDNILDVNNQIKNYNKIIANNIKKIATLQDINNIASFQEDYKALHHEDYNRLIEKQKTHLKQFLQKKKLKKIKQNTYGYIETLLYLFKYQVENKTNQLIKLKQPTYRVLSKFDLNQRNIKTHRVYGIQKYKNTCLKTIKSHINILVATGVLKNKIYRGNRASLLVDFSSEIIVINDQNPYFYDNTQNQLVNIQSRKKTDDIKHTINNNNKIKFKRKKSEKINSCLADGLQNHKSVSPIKKEENIKRKKVAPKKEFYLKNNYQFSKELEQNNISTPLMNKEELINEGINGYLSRKQYNQLIIQQIILFSFYKLYKNHRYIKIYAGNVQTAITMIEKRFMNNNYFLKKEVAIKTYETFIKSILNTYNFNKKNNFEKVLNLKDYFDPSRKYEEEGGFQFQFLKLIRKEREKNNKINKKQQKINKLKSNSLRRKAMRYEIMYESALKKYKNGKYKTFDQLWYYVSSNLPKKYVKKLEYDVNNNYFC